MGCAGGQSAALPSRAPLLPGLRRPSSDSSLTWQWPAQCARWAARRRRWWWHARGRGVARHCAASPPTAAPGSSAGSQQAKQVSDVAARQGQRQKDSFRCAVGWSEHSTVQSRAAGAAISNHSTQPAQCRLSASSAPAHRRLEGLVVGPHDGAHPGLQPRGGVAAQRLVVALVLIVCRQGVGGCGGGGGGAGRQAV